MFNINKEKIKWDKSILSIETGNIARQADGSVVVSYGDTTVLCTVVFSKEINQNLDFASINVNYQERFYATGKIPGGFFKREGRGTEKEIITSRLIDRPLRSIFPESFHNETQVLITVISNDRINNPDIPSLIGASAALYISGIPISEPIGGARIGYKKGEYILNPSKEELKDSDLDLVLAGTKDSILMVESEAKEINESIVLEALKFGHKKIQPVIEAIIKLGEKIQIKKEIVKNKNHEEFFLQKNLIENYKNKLVEIYKLTKKERENEILKLKGQFINVFSNTEKVYDENTIITNFKKLEKKIVRSQIMTSSKRIDGRNFEDIRQIDSKVGFLPRTHGSSLFTRGETQSLAITTLGTSQDEQIIDAIEGEYKERFILNYNFPPYSVGEIGRVGSPKRREIGHGKLAWKAISSILPKINDFPYTIRIVSEITESNGSSSMATVCSGVLSMMDAGVPITNIVAGIAMGLIIENEKNIILSDITGEEDYLGDMDFKIAGSKNGITALQMDIKTKGITFDIIEKSLQQAKNGREHIIKEMTKTLKTNNEVGKYAPKMTTINIPQEKIREVIGSGGKTIKDICEKTNSKIDISNEGLVKISSEERQNMLEALKRVKEIVMEPEVGQIYKGKVVKIMEFGAFVNFLGPRDGLVHISELTQERIRKVNDIIKEGDIVYVQLVGFDRGKARLSMKVVDQKTGKSVSRMSINSEE